MKRLSNNKAVLVDRLLRESSVPSMDLAKIEAVPWLSLDHAALYRLELTCKNLKMESFS